MSNKLEVKRVKDKDEFKFELKKPLSNPDILPDISKRLLFLIYGKVGSSKSTLLMNLLYNPNFFEGQFKTKFVISPTIFQDATLWPLREDDEAVLIDEYSDAAIETIVDSQKELLEMSNTPELSALILEDALSDSATSSNNSAISKLATTYRHRYLNIFIVSQAVNQISSLIRANTRVIFVKKLGSTKEINKFSDNFSDQIGGPKYFLRMYNYVFNKPENRYDMLYINLDRQEVYHNFDKLLYKDEKEYI